MVKISLKFKAQLVNVTNLTPEGEDFRWYLKLKCLNCGEEADHFQYLTLSENSPLKGGRGHASLVLKCKLCSRENSIDIIADSIKPYTAEHSEQFVPMVTFDCRGVEPTDFSPRVGFRAESSESNTKFPEVDLTEKEWCDYDEKVDMEVGIYEVQCQFVKA